MTDSEDLNIQSENEQRFSPEQKKKMEAELDRKRKQEMLKLETDNKKLYDQIKERTKNFKRDDQESSRYVNIIKLTRFKKSFELDLKTPELLFDPIYENMVFLMKFTVIICEKIKRFFARKYREQGLERQDATTLFRVKLEKGELSTLKSLAYRVVFYIGQLRNFLEISIQKNILTPKFYLLYSQKHPGEFKTLRELQTSINGVALEQFLKQNKDRLGFVDSYFRRNAMKLLTIRQFKRTFTSKYLKDSVLKTMSFFKVTPDFRNSLCEFYYFYNMLADFFYIFQTDYVSKQYTNYKQQQAGNGSTIFKRRARLRSREFANVVRLQPRLPTTQELKIMSGELVKNNVKLGIGKRVIDNLRLFNKAAHLGSQEKKEKGETLDTIMDNLDQLIVTNHEKKQELDELKAKGGLTREARAGGAPDARRKPPRAGPGGARGRAARRGSRVRRRARAQRAGARRAQAGHPGRHGGR